MKYEIDCSFAVYYTLEVGLSFLDKFIGHDCSYAASVSREWPR